MQADAASLDSLWVHLSPDDNTLKTTQLAAQSSASESLKAQNNLNKDINQVCLIDTHVMAVISNEWFRPCHQLLLTALSNRMQHRVCGPSMGVIFDSVCM